MLNTYSCIVTLLVDISMTMYDVYRQILDDYNLSIGIESTLLVNAQQVDGANAVILTSHYIDALHEIVNAIADYATDIRYHHIMSINTPVFDVSPVGMARNIDTYFDGFVI